MEKKILIPLYGNDVAPRFDLAGEVMIAGSGEEEAGREERIVVMSRASADNLCHMVLTEKAGEVICGGIEEEHYQYLKWKR
ncbi:MAG: dinitrogenase iron-molybdenum cofactor biosynthesis protein, partial [Okeania sp. SIO3C4]|nr:dinitrogenase iron-molybdenum cofactor biosynthesis protein [Okeania sp. SIO3C4]